MGMEYQRPSALITSSSSTTTRESPAATAAEGMVDSPDSPLKLIGFEYDKIAPGIVSGRLPVTAKVCQPFKVLHGGVSAMVAEGLASLGAHFTGDRLKRVVGIHLSINHVQSAKLGDLVSAEATPVNVGRTIQVWEVKLWKTDDHSNSNTKKKTLISSSRVTLLCSMPIPNRERNIADGLNRFAKL